MAIKHVAPAILPVVATFLLVLHPNVISAASSLAVVGSVFCDTCLEHQFSETTSYFIPGAVVAVECSINRRTATTVYMEGETDEYGDFMVEIPWAFQSSKGCSVRMVRSPEGEECNIPSTTTPLPLVFSPNSHHKTDGDETYNAGSFSYRQLNVAAMCYRSRSRRAALEEEAQVIPSIKVPPLPFPFPLPASPSIPLPQLQFPPLPFTFPFPSAPPAKENEPSKDNSNPPLAKPTFPPLPSINPNPNPNPSNPFPRPPPLPFQFPPIPFLIPPPPSTPTKTP